ncbi:MAG: carbamoyltransferase HypF [Planctomycetales bacterium]|nr:carbamoyltransferase HypF [Planctomycetales bacterium]
MRPTLARLAEELCLSGYAVNSPRGAECVVAGDASAVAAFESRLRELLRNGIPVGAVVEAIESQSFDPQGHAYREQGGDQLGEFTIRSSVIPEADGASLSAKVPPDAVVCDHCLRELRDPRDRRHHYAFLSCIACGPRYSIVDAMPYERGRTTMREFPLCPRCAEEFDSTTNRRFHAETTACPACGPQLWLSRDGSRADAIYGHDAVRQAATVIRNEQVLALKGLGGYQLLVAARSDRAVGELRRRKRRPAKPLAVMVRTAADAAALATVSDVELRWLHAPSGPIVICDALANHSLSRGVSCGLHTVGLMLPTTPLHVLLLDELDMPLVCTSCNLDGEPILFEGNGSRSALAALADNCIEHNRPIRRPVDDSVLRVMAGRPVGIRIGRGLAPASIAAPTSVPIIAVGAHQKVAVAIANGAQTVLGPHIGDMGSTATRRRFVEQQRELADLYGTPEALLVADEHPDYFTTAWTRSRVEDSTKPVSAMMVQHHHAHVVSGMVEHGWLDRQVLGIAFDGVGWGRDGTLWGGELLLATAAEFDRVGSLRPFRQLGGEQVVREPWRVALALAHEVIGDEAMRLGLAPASDCELLLRASGLSPWTTSVGRLFDGVAALALGIHRAEFEGQPAMLLESSTARCDLQGAAKSDRAAYRFDIGIRADGMLELDWRPAVQQVIADVAIDASPASIGARFHDALALAVFKAAAHWPTLPVVLSGGVFQNRCLVERLASAAADDERPWGLPGIIPPNDGGLAAGQIAIAAARAVQ